MGRLYTFLGLTVGVNLPQMSREEKQAAYRADITYGTNNEFGFDYLRDNMVHEVADRVARGLHYAIVDEVDSILIDEARTPLIISGQAEDHTELYVRINAVVPQLKKQIGELDLRTGEGVIDPGDFTVDEKSHQVYLTEDGHENAERILSKAGLLPEGASLYDAANIALMHHVYAALRANHLYNRDQHYVVQDGEVVIVDEFTGRLMTGRRWSDGLHQAVEAKEKVAIQNENQTLASITFQNYCRMYDKLAGMTGTADTEAYEFQEIYGLETVVIPPNKPSSRTDRLDQVYKSAQEKFNAIIMDIEDCRERGQPVLVGTTSIENSELRGRSGRQGDPGSSCFYLSLDDRLLRIFAGGRVRAIMDRLKMPEGEPIEAGMVMRSIESAQRKVEARNFDMRKQLLEYDDVANDQRKTIYALRNELLESDDVSQRIAELRAGVIADLFRVYVPEDSVEEQWDIAGLESALKAELALELPLRGWPDKEPDLNEAILVERIGAKADEAYATKVPAGAEVSFHQYERYVTLQILDAHWREHLAALDHLRQGIHLRGYAQKNPKQEYKREAFELFGAMVEAVKLEVTTNLTMVQIGTKEDLKPDDQSHVENIRPQHADSGGMNGTEPEESDDANVAVKQKPVVRHVQKVGRNDPCPCASGKENKHCHGN